MGHCNKVMVVTLGVLIGCATTSHAQSMNDAVKAPRVRDRIDISIKSDANDKPVLQYVLDSEDRTPVNFRPGLVFLGDPMFGDDQIKVAVRNFNPFDAQVTASVTDSDDPAHLALTQLLQALTGVAGILRPDLAKEFNKVTSEQTLSFVEPTEAPCQPLRDSQDELRRLIDVLYPTELSGASLRGSIRTWSSNISTDGYTALVKAKDELSVLSKTAVSAAAAGKSAVESFENAAATARQRPDWPSPSCRRDTLALFDLARLADPAERLRELEAVGGSIKKLVDVLGRFAGSNDWIEDSSRKLRTWIAARIDVDEAKSRLVTIKAGVVGFSANDDAGITSKTVAETSEAFSLRQYRRLIPEIGVGAVIADLRRPKYVVGKDANGASIVARGASEEVPAGAAIMGNLVWRMNLGIGAPMFQLGALPSKDAPGFFAGFGFRFFARFGIGGGIVQWWAKDLRVDANDPTLLALGKPVSTQKEIEDKLTWVGRHNFYASIQYSFK